MGIVDLIRQFYGRVTPANPYVWHRWHSFKPAVRLIDGRWWQGGLNQLWRRKTTTGWEYKADDETDEDVLDKAW